MFFFKVTSEKAQVYPKTWARIIAYVTGMSVTVEGGKELKKNTPYIFAANHVSQFDIFALQGFLNFDFRWLAKKELFEIPVFGPAMRMAGYIPVDRSRGRQALQSLNEAAERIAAGTSVIIFPEGTRSANGKLQAFKSGAMVLAIKAGVPIVPVTIKGTYHILPKGERLAKPGKVTIRIGSEIETKSLKSSDKLELATKVHREVARMLI